MKQKRYSYVGLFIVLLVFSCTSGKKAFEKGNYDQALQKATNRLRQNPNNKKAIETLQMGYPFAINWHLDNVEKFRVSNVVFAFERINAEYKRINYLNDEIRKCPSCLNVVSNLQTFIFEENASAEKAAEIRYSFGEQLLSESIEEGNKQKGIDAYYHFVKANELIRGYANVYTKIEESKWAATTKVVIEEVMTGSRMLDVSADFFYNNIQNHLAQLLPSQFVRFYSPIEAQSNKVVNPDQIIRLQFDYFDVGQVHIKEKEMLRFKDSVIVGKTKDADGNKVDVYGTVKARVFSKSKKVVSDGVLDLTIIDFNSGRVLTQEKLLGEHIWVTKWGHFRGNEKALNERDWEIVNSRKVQQPHPQELFVAFTQPIFDQVTYKLGDFYSRYQ